MLTAFSWNAKGFVNRNPKNLDRGLTITLIRGNNINRQGDQETKREAERIHEKLAKTHKEEFFESCIVVV
jgi:hypothetical protein